jgi:hypothetical protein
MIDEMIKQPYPQSDLEYVMNWRFEVWNDADITVAMGEGLFTHREIGEHGAIDFTSMRIVSVFSCVWRLLSVLCSPWRDVFESLVSAG